MTLETLKNRHSVRDYDIREIPESIASHLKAEITHIRTHEAGLHFQIFFNDPSPFDSFLKSYGLFKNVRNYVACVVDDFYPDTWQRAGYYAEQFVMCAVKLGLGTCFVGGTYDSSSVKAEIRVGWKLPFIIAFGYPSENKPGYIKRMLYRQMHLKDKSPEDFLDKSEDAEQFIKANPWVETGLKGLACAPSSLNKQPVRIRINDGRVEAYTNSKEPARMIDLGIGMWNFEAVAKGYWDFGNPAVFHPF